MTLAQFRKDKFMTQNEMASALGVSFSHYSKIEAGIRNPSYNFLSRLKEKFPEIDVDAVFFKDI